MEVTQVHVNTIPQHMLRETLHASDHEKQFFFQVILKLLILRGFPSVVRLSYLFGLSTLEAYGWFALRNEPPVLPVKPSIHGRLP